MAPQDDVVGYYRCYFSEEYLYCSYLQNDWLIKFMIKISYLDINERMFTLHRIKMAIRSGK